MHETSQNRHYTPGNHDPCNPFSRAPAFNGDGSRYLEQNVGEIKHAYAKAVDAIAETQVGAHPEIGEGNVHAIDVIHDIEEEHERKQSVRNSPSCSNTNCW